MKFRVHMKDPDTLHDAVKEAADASAAAVDGLGESERAYLAKSRADDALRVCRRWFEFGEYLTVEIDTDAGTAVVVPR